MGKITFILGGARSGKSAYALKSAGKHKKVAFIATCQPLDSEMKKRIALHQQARPKNWKTFEEYSDLASLIKKIPPQFEMIIIDCVTLLISNLFLKGVAGKDIENKTRLILKALKKQRRKSLIVSNEVGLGIVPDTKAGRDFRDLAGRINQIIAKESDEVFFMVSGIPWRVK